MRYDDPYFSEFLAYWKALAAGCNGVPTRNQFRPEDIKKSLPHVFIVERHPGYRYEIRLTGSGFDFATHGEYRIGNDLNRYPERDRKAYGIYFDTIFAGPCAAWSERVFVSPSGKAFLTYNVSVPLYDDAKGMQLALGMVRTAAVPERAGEIEIKGEEYSRLLALRYFDVGYGVPEGVWAYQSNKQPKG